MRTYGMNELLYIDVIELDLKACPAASLLSSAIADQLQI